MLIAVAGPYSADTAEKMQANLDAMNNACTEVYKKGHIPVTGVNNALPVVNILNDTNRYKDIMKISLSIVERCDAILVIGISPGVLMEKDSFIKRDLPIYYSIEEIPDCE